MHQKKKYSGKWDFCENILFRQNTTFYSKISFWNVIIPQKQQQKRSVFLWEKKSQNIMINLTNAIFFHFSVGPTFVWTKHSLEEDRNNNHTIGLLQRLTTTDKVLWQWSNTFITLSLIPVGLSFQGIKNQMVQLLNWRTTGWCHHNRDEAMTNALRTLPLSMPKSLWSWGYLLCSASNLSQQLFILHTFFKRTFAKGTTFTLRKKLPILIYRKKYFINTWKCRTFSELKKKKYILFFIPLNVFS